MVSNFFNRGNCKPSVVSDGFLSLRRDVVVNVALKFVKMSDCHTQICNKNGTLRLASVKSFKKVYLKTNLLSLLYANDFFSLFRYTHIEAECPFISFDDLLKRLEDLVCDVVDRVMKSPAGELLKDLNPVCHVSLLFV